MAATLADPHPARPISKYCLFRTWNRVFDTDMGPLTNRAVDNVGRLVAAPDSGLIVDRPLPLELRGPPFTIADGAWVGLSKSWMAASGLFRPTHGARIDTRPDTIHEIARVRHQPPAAGAGQRLDVHRDHQRRRSRRGAPPPEATAPAPLPRLLTPDPGSRRRRLSTRRSLLRALTRRNPSRLPANAEIGVEESRFRAGHGRFFDRGGGQLATAAARLPSEFSSFSGETSGKCTFSRISLSVTALQS